MSTRDLRIEIGPIWIESTDQGYLPDPIPFLNLLLPSDCFIDIIARLIIDQPPYAVFLCESPIRVVPVLIYPCHEIGSYTDVQSPVFSARQYVYESLFHDNYSFADH